MGEIDVVRSRRSWWFTEGAAEMLVNPHILSVGYASRTLRLEI
jgi:hypothetical protein